MLYCRFHRISVFFPNLHFVSQHCTPWVSSITHLFPIVTVFAMKYQRETVYTSIILVSESQNERVISYNCQIHICQGQTYKWYIFTHITNKICKNHKTFVVKYTIYNLNMNLQCWCILFYKFMAHFLPISNKVIFTLNVGLVWICFYFLLVPNPLYMAHFHL